MSGVRVFVSYRRDDSRHLAGRLADHLRWEADVHHVFFDTSAIAPGAAFPKAIDDALSCATHTLVVIGPKWSGGAGAGQGRSRLFDDGDFVRREVAAALAGPGEVIPVLVDGAQMPTGAELPPSLQALRERNAFAVHHDRSFQDDLRPLIKHIIGHEPRGGDTVWSIGAKVVGGAVAGLVVFVVASALLQFGLGLDAEDLFGAADPRAARERFALLPWFFGGVGAVALPLLRRRWQLPWRRRQRA